MIEYINNQINIDGFPLEEIVLKRETPFYLYSWNQIKKNIQVIHNAFQGLNYHISFAAKANNNLYILEGLKNMGIGIDVVSLGELMAAKAVGFPRDHVIINGNGKSKELLREILNHQPRSLNIDSHEELYRLEVLTREEKKKIHVALRVNPDVDAVTHPYISTGLKKNKFGIELNTARQLISKYYNDPYIIIKGLHLHIGSQIMQVSPYHDAYLKIYDFVNSLTKHQLSFINIGGGWGIDYMREGNSFPLEEYVERVVPVLKKMNMEIILELGRFILANAGVLVGRIEYIKETPHKTFVVTDASMADLIRPSLYNAYHHIFPQYNEGEEKELDIVGPLCETGDRFTEGRLMKIPKVGEHLVICDTGAYGRVMSSNYNYSLKPPEYMIIGKEIKTIRTREVFEDTISYYKGGLNSIP